MVERFVAWIDENPVQLGHTERTRARVQHAGVALLAVVGGAYLVLFLIQGLPVASLTLVVAIPCAIAGLLLLTRRGRVTAGGVVISLAIFIIIAVTLVARGGMPSNAAAWLLVAPMMSFSMVGARHGVQSAVAAALFYAALWTVQQLGVPMPAGLPPAVVEWMPPVDYTGIALMFLALLWVQEGMWDGIVARLDGANHELQAEITVRQSAEGSAQRAAETRYRFLATMSHEIRTPLNGVLGLTEVLLHGDLDPEQRQLTSTMQSSGELLRSILDDVLDFSKIDSGRLDLELQPVNLRQICTDLGRLWHGPAAERGVELKVTIAPRAPTWVRGDPNKLRQILGNLVSNAVKFTEAGHVHVIVPESPDLVVQVEDTGIGLDEAALAHIFEPFRQADQSTARRFGGTGLGLAICRRLAAAMDGELSVQSTLGPGTTFTLRLPLHLEEEPTLVRQAHAELRVQGRVVLVAEDNPVNQTVMRHLLERHGLRVIVSGDGDAAVREWEAHQPDLILMDCQMPICDGYEATRRIRAMGGTVPIVAVTANTMPGDRARSFDAGMDGHIGKPVRPEQLKQALRQWLPRVLRDAVEPA